MFYVLVAGNQFTMALGHSASARLARHFANGHIGSFLRLLGGMAALGVAAGLQLTMSKLATTSVLNKTRNVLFIFISCISFYCF